MHACKLSSEVGLLVLINPLYSEPYMGFDCGFQWDSIETFLPAVGINYYVMKGSEKKNTQTALLIVIKGSRIVL